MPEQERQITAREGASRKVSFLPSALCGHATRSGSHVHLLASVLTPLLGVPWEGGAPQPYPQKGQGLEEEHP